ncbi:MAG: helix-turn-helix domain-containing protein [Oscillospiraceae bacterium]|nr:helix-turn-helix domain-containing protein [Oscillospiraceae bacterium]
MFIDIFLQLCEENDVKPTRVANEIGSSSASVVKWRKGAIPQGITLQKIADYFGVSVDYLLTGETKKSPDILSGVENTISFENFKQIPIIGTIACGEPILAEENHEGYTNVEINVHADFALRCKGDSMAPKFLDGDVVLIRQQPDVENGQIAAVLIDNEATLKRVYKNPDDILLSPENLSYRPMVYSGEEMNNIRILGLAIGYTRIF